MFSYRYDAHLVPDLVENLSPMVDGWVAWDDRGSPERITDENALRCQLLDAAFEAGADWVLRVDPDERFEHSLADRMDDLTALPLPIVWMFRLRELYTPTSYRRDGIWGRKRQGRLFPLHASLVPAASSGRFPRQPFHSPFVPSRFIPRDSGIDLYHLKMICPERRRRRRDLYAELDPGNVYQRIGYDYLIDESTAVFEAIPADRGYTPRHREDGGSWMAPLHTERERR